MTHNNTTQVRVPVGVNTQTIVADSTQSSGLIWKYPFGSFYQYSESLGNNTTTSTTFQTKLTFTTTTLPAGTYILHTTAHMTSNNDDRNFAFQTRVNTVDVDTWTTNITRNAQKSLYTYIGQYVVATNQALTLDIRFRVVQTSQTLTISNAKIIIYRASD
jgi:hypothetical protein